MYPAARVFSIFALMVLAVPATTNQTDFWNPADLKSAADKLSAESQSKGIAGKTLGAWGSHSASLWRRAKSGEAEMHKTKADVIVVQDGSATLVTGGSIPDAHTTQPNEIRGSSIRGGVSRKLAPGDIVHIQPNTPHQFLLDKGQFVSYFALKVSER